jgi:hypothetical protein
MSSSKRGGRAILAALLIGGLLIAASLLAACAEGGSARLPTTAPFPSPTPRPTARVTIAEALDGARFTLHLGEQLVGVEEFAVQSTEAGLVVYSELRSNQGLELLQRRTLLLSSADTPLRYELEERSGGARSLWIAERAGDALAVLNDDLNLPLPVLVEGLTAPTVLIEGRPSALPYALLAWRLSGAGESESVTLPSLDVTEPLPAAQELTAGAGGAGTGEVIGATGYHGSAPGALNPEFDLWIRDRTRSLVRVLAPGYRLGLSAQAVWPGLPDGESLVIQRVAELPELAPATPQEGETITFTDAQGQARTALLQLPEGAGPHPLAVLLGPEGLRPPWQGGEALLAAGWATATLTPRGLAPGQARYARGAFAAQAADAAALAQALATRSDIDVGRLALMGWREGVIVAAQSLVLADSPFAAAVLLEPPAARALFPQALERRIERVLTPAYGWTPEQAGRYADLTVDVGRGWLFEGDQEITALGRRLDVSYLRAHADADLGALLAQSQQPVLLLAELEGRWSSPEVVEALSTSRAGVTAVTMTEALFAGQTERLSESAATAIAEWLSASAP